MALVALVAFVFACFVGSASFLVDVRPVFRLSLAAFFFFFFGGDATAAGEGD